jgi:general transcription factor 3C polypeptide 3 (transcription factor C subunit 4)
MSSDYEDDDDDESIYSEEESVDYEQEGKRGYYDDDEDDEDEEEEGDEEYEDEEYGYEEEDEDEDEDEYEKESTYEDEIDMDLSRSASTIPAEDEDTVNAIIESVQHVLPELGAASARGPVRMTDLGHKISQLVLHRRPTQSPSIEQSVMEEEKDAFLEKTLSGRRRNRTGVRGRPKKVDYGFGKSTTHVLPPEVARLMGQANVSYVSRKYEDAIALLLEVVRQAPHAFEAYQTLGLVHEEKGDLDKALSYYIIAAHLIKHDTDLWRKLARLTLEIGNRPTEAIYYLSKLIRMRDPRPEYFWTRARLWVEREEYKKGILGFHRLLLAEVEGDAQTFEQVATLADRLDHSDLIGSFFVQIISQAITTQRCPSLAVVMYVLEWLMERKEPDKMQVLIESVAVALVGETGVALPAHWFAMEQAERMSVALLSLPIEIRLYFAIATVNLKRGDPSLFNELPLDPHRHGRLMKILGKALLASAQPADALSLLLPLMDVPELGDPDLGILIGECYRLISGQEEMAISTFEAVLEVCPERNDARTALCDLYRQKGEMDKASAVLKQAEGKWTDSVIVKATSPKEPLDVDSVFAGLFAWDQATGLADESQSQSRLLHLKQSTIRKRKRLRRPRRLRQYIIYSATQIHAAQQVFHKIMELAEDANSMRQIRQLANPLIEDMLSNPSIRPSHKARQLVRTTDLALLHGLTTQQWFALLCKFLVVECNVGSLERSHKLTRMFLSRSVFALDRQSAATLRLLQIGIAARMESRPSILISTARMMLRAWADQPISLAVLMRAIWRGTPELLDGPFARFLERHISRNPHNTLVYAASVAVFLYTERYDYTIRAGYCLLSIAPDHTLGLLATTVASLHQSLKRTCHHPAVLQRRALALLHHYLTVVGDEGNYNVARAYHMLGLFDLATIYYRRALNGMFKEEAAFNLHLLMLQSGECDLAAHILANYISA